MACVEQDGPELTKMMGCIYTVFSGSGADTGGSLNVDECLPSSYISTTCSFIYIDLSSTSQGFVLILRNHVS